MSGAIDAPDAVRDMFDRIAPRYDLMNRLMSGWQDLRWRRAAAQAALNGGGGRVLDAATGTGDLAEALREAGATDITAVDASPEMLARAGARFIPHANVRVQMADVMRLPFGDGVFDACTIGFGLRNLPGYQAGINEMARVLMPGGRLVVLEATPLEDARFGVLFEPYFSWVVPRIGGLITGDRSAYEYLPESVRNFPNAEGLAGMLHVAGLTRIRWRYFAAGTVALHVGVKPGGASS